MTKKKKTTKRSTTKPVSDYKITNCKFVGTESNSDAAKAISDIAAALTANAMAIETNAQACRQMAHVLSSTGKIDTMLQVGPKSDD